MSRADEISQFYYTAKLFHHLANALTVGSTEKEVNHRTFFVLYCMTNIKIFLPVFFLDPVERAAFR